MERGRSSVSSSSLACFVGSRSSVIVPLVPTLCVQFVCSFNPLCFSARTLLYCFPYPRVFRLVGQKALSTNHPTIEKPELLRTSPTSNKPGVNFGFAGPPGEGGGWVAKETERK